MTSGIFTEEDLRILDRTKSIRESIVNNLYSNKKDLPTSAKDVEAAVALLDSMDRNVLEKVKLQIKDESNKNNSETKAILSQLLLNIHSKSTDEAVESSIPEFSSDGRDIAFGELVEGVDNVNVSVLEK